MNAFETPANFTFGNMRRNSLISDWSKNVDLSLFRSIHFEGDKRLELRFEAYNLTNTPVFSAPLNDLTDTENFGSVNQVANTARELQIAAKFYF
jgi:hypothetical protein